MVIVVALAAVACSDDPDAASTPSTTRSTTSSTTSSTSTSTTTATAAARTDESFVGEAAGTEVAVYPSAGAARPERSLPNPNENGAPLVFLLVRPYDGQAWVEVALPVRPNGSRGWVRAEDLRIASHGYRLRVARALAPRSR